MSVPQNRCTEYLARAEDARRKALAANDFEAREVWHRIAEHWQELAEQVLRTEKFQGAIFLALNKDDQVQ